MNYAMLAMRSRAVPPRPVPTITISSQPTNQTSSAGSVTLSVSASASDGGDLSYQWQRSTDSGVTWVNVSGETSPALALSGLTNDADNGDLYRVVVSAADAESVISAAASIAVYSYWWGEIVSPERLASASYDSFSKILQIVAGPVPLPEVNSKGFDGLFASITADFNPSNLNMNGGTAVAISVGPAGVARGASMQMTIIGRGPDTSGRMWMGIVDAHTVSSSQADGGSYATSTSETWQDQIYGHPNQAPVDIEIKDYISSGESFYSLSRAFVSLRLSPRITISQQPSNQSASGGEASFFVSASVQDGSTPSYQWQKSDDGGLTWANVSGGTSSTLSLFGLTNADDDSDRYRVVVSSAGSVSVTSEVAVLSVQA